MLLHETLWYYLSSSQWHVRSLSRDRPGADCIVVSIGPVSCKQRDGACGVRVRECLLSHGLFVAGDLLYGHLAMCR